MESLQIKLFASPLWVKKPSGVILDKHLNGWKTCECCHQSKALMSLLLSSRTKKPQEMSRWKLKVAEGLLMGHTNPRTHIFELGITQQQDCQLGGPNKKIAYVLYVFVWHWHVQDKEPWVNCS
jgi:hypothetical protein